MKASASPHILTIVLLALAGSLTLLAAEDVVVLKNGQRRPGTILGIAGEQLKLKVGPVETSLPMDQVESVTMEAPKDFETALDQWREGDAAKTLATLKPLVDKFIGLPTPWAERAAALLGDVYLALDKIPDAETAFAAFQAAYPDSTSMSEIGLARLAVTKKDFVTAKEKLTPIVTEASGVKVAPAGRSAMYGQAFFLMGTIRESEGNLPEALQDYLSAATLFHEDKAIAAKAQEKARFLIEEKNVIVP